MEQIPTQSPTQPPTNSVSNTDKSIGTKILLGVLLLGIIVLIILGLRFVFSKNVKMKRTDAIVIGDSYPSCENVIKENSEEQVINCLVNIKYNVNDTEYKKMINIKDAPEKIEVGDELELEYDIDNPETVVLCCTSNRRRGVYFLTTAFILLLLAIIVNKKY